MHPGRAKVHSGGTPLAPGGQSGYPKLISTPLTLAELELRCRELGYCRVSRTMVANLRRVESLRSLPAGRIECTMQNGERLIVSRRYAPLLREQLGVDR